MAFDGAGVFLRLRSWIADATAGVKIRADFHDDEDNNFAGGLSQCIVKDGQTTITQNIPWNSKRITALADPVNAQDAATKAYADTKAPLVGDVPFTGDVTIKNDDPALTLDGKDGFKNSIFGDKNSKHRWEIVIGNATPETGSNVGSDFELINYADDGTLIGDVFFGERSTGLMTVKANPTAALGIATKQYADTKLPLAGGTITGGLTVVSGLIVNASSSIAGGLVVATLVADGEINAKGNLVSFGPSTSNAFIRYMGGMSYQLGSGGIIWHTGNFNPTGLQDRIEALEAFDPTALLERIAALEAKLRPQP